MQGYGCKCENFRWIGWIRFETYLP